MAQVIPARAQLLAVGWLRWRLFLNGIRRQGGARRPLAGLLLLILLRLIVWTVLAVLSIGPILGSGFLAWDAIAHGHGERLLALLAGISALWQFLAMNGMNMAAITSSFTPSSLIRFPLPFGLYLLLRTFFGLMTPSTIIFCLALLATTVGMGIADHALGAPAFAVLAVYAWTNILFSQMLAAWLERWLATRRFREAYGALMLLFFLGIQLLNFRTTPGTHGVSGIWWVTLWHVAGPFLRWLPPGLAYHSLPLRRYAFSEFAALLALLAYTALFLALYAIRLHKQFLGEYLSEAPVLTTPATSASPARRISQPSGGLRKPGGGAISPIIAACLRKEWLELRGAGSQVIGMVSPLVFVVILGKGIFRLYPSFFLPGALTYVLLSLLPRLYNIFGVDGNGVQLYLLAPIRLRDVILAKNMSSLLLIVFQAVLAWAAVMMISSAPIVSPAQVSACLWLIFVIAANLALGTLRSIQAPLKFVPGQLQQVRNPTSRTSRLLVVALSVGSLILQIPVTLLGRRFGLPWLGAGIFGVLASAAVISYVLLLHYADRLILGHRDLFAEELCR